MIFTGWKKKKTRHIESLKDCSWCLLDNSWVLTLLCRRCVLLLAWQCLPFTFFHFSFLDTGETTHHIKTGCSIRNFTLRHPPLSLHFWICRSEWGERKRWTRKGPIVKVAPSCSASLLLKTKKKYTSLFAFWSPHDGTETLCFTVIMHNRW